MFQKKDKYTMNCAGCYVCPVAIAELSEVCFDLPPNEAGDRSIRLSVEYKTKENSVDVFVWISFDSHEEKHWVSGRRYSHAELNAEAYEGGLPEALVWMLSSSDDFLTAMRQAIVSHDAEAKR